MNRYVVPAINSVAAVMRTNVPVFVVAFKLNSPLPVFWGLAATSHAERFYLVVRTATISGRYRILGESIGNSRCAAVHALR